jgi:hypothetical protein
MDALSLNTQKFIIASLLGMTTLMMGSAMMPDACTVKSALWNEQIQSSANFISTVSRQCR